MIDLKHSDKQEYKETLNRYAENITVENIDFSINGETVILYFLNPMPRLFMSLGFLAISIKDLEFKINYRHHLAN
jgi:hypothetical protein